ncbi:MAG TPA: hypothetical protein VIU43_00635, partial [Nitrosospira sp.]
MIQNRLMMGLRFFSFSLASGRVIQRAINSIFFFILAHLIATTASATSAVSGSAPDGSDVHAEVRYD